MRHWLVILALAAFGCDGSADSVGNGNAHPDAGSTTLADAGADATNGGNPDAGAHASDGGHAGNDAGSANDLGSGGAAGADAAVIMDVGMDGRDAHITAIDEGMPQPLDAGIEPLIDAATLHMDMAGPDAMAEVEPVVNCFPEDRNQNLSASSFYEGPRSEGSVLCNASNASDLDLLGAELGFDGGLPFWVSNQEVTSCLVADLGQQCMLNEHVGVGVSTHPLSEACIPAMDQSPTGQCDVEGLCGTQAGASALIFVATQLDDPRFVARVGGCGAGFAINTLVPLNAFSEVNTLDSVRYLMVCRPYQNCDASQADMSVDALYLVRR